jgi:hypothetical protein
VVTAFRALLHSRRDGGARGVVERALEALEAAALRTNETFEAQHVSNTLHIMAKPCYRPWDRTLVPELEGRAEALTGSFKAQHVANTMWAYATMGREPGAGWMRELEGRAEAVAGTFKAQDVANTMWAYATMGRESGAGVMRELAGRAEALAGTFNAQDVANTLWAVCVFSILRVPGAEVRLLHTMVQRLVSLDTTACFNAFALLQLHQIFVWCSVEKRLDVEAIDDLLSLKATCRSAFDGAQTAPSASQPQVSKTLRDMGLSVEDEVRFPNSGYSIDMLVHAHDSALETGCEMSSGRVWAVEGLRTTGLRTSLQVGRRRVPLY